MSGFFFSGSNVAKLDEKGRFVLPQEMRFGLVEEGKCQFSVGLGMGGCLAIYKKSVIEKMVAKFRENQHVARFQKFFTFFFSTLYQTECDKVGRVMLPLNLRKAASIEKKIVVVGVMDQVQLWNEEVYNQTLSHFLESKTKALSIEEAFSLLHDREEPSAQEAVKRVLEDAHPCSSARSSSDF